MHDDEIKPILEALLFVSSDPVSLERLHGVFDGVEKARIKALLLQLVQASMLANRGFHLVEIAGGYQYVSRSDLGPWIKEMERARAASRLSKPGLETLAIVAYKQPVTRGEIEMIRGVDAAGVLKTLLDRKLLKIVGRKEVAGRPILYGTTRTFLKYLGLPSLSALPTLKAFSEFVDEAELEEAPMLPLGDLGHEVPQISDLASDEETSL